MERTNESDVGVGGVIMSSDVDRHACCAPATCLYLSILEDHAADQDIAWCGDCGCSSGVGVGGRESCKLSVAGVMSVEAHALLIA